MVAYRRILPVAALLLFGCSSSGTAGNAGGFIGTGTPGSSAETPGTGSNVPASSDTLPVAQTPDSICGTLCGLGLKYECVAADVGGSLATCTTECVSTFDQLTKDISLDCWGAIIQLLQCADRAHALSCKQKCDQTVGAGGAPNGQPTGQNCTSDLSIDEQAAAQCVDIANRFPQCNFDFGGGSTSNCGGIQDPCAKCECQNPQDAAACSDVCTAGGNCQYPNCGGCTSTCDTCLCALQGDTTACAASCGG